MTMARAFAAVVVAAMVAALTGCRGEMRDVMTLNNTGAAPPAEQMMTVTQRGTYYLYSSKVPDAEKYRRELWPGNQLGFRSHGNRVEAFAEGSIVELEEYSEGASYVWKLEEKKKP